MVNSVLQNEIAWINSSFFHCRYLFQSIQLFIQEQRMTRKKQQKPDPRKQDHWLCSLERLFQFWNAWFFYIASCERLRLDIEKRFIIHLFLFQLYHLASVRLRDLCEQLYIDDVDLRKKMWTCFEYVLVNHVELMMDRHIDQIIMCAIYVMAKVNHERK